MLGRHESHAVHVIPDTAAAQVFDVAYMQHWLVVIGCRKHYNQVLLAADVFGSQISCCAGI
jgi:hypothetical protein